MIGQQPRLDVTMAVRTKMYTGALPTPAAPPEKVFVGWGNGRACDACDQAISAAEPKKNTRNVRVPQLLSRLPQTQ